MRGVSLCLCVMTAYFTGEAPSRGNAPAPPAICPQCQGLMRAEDREEEQAYQAWEAQGYTTYLRNTSQDLLNRWGSRTQVPTAQPNVAQAPIIPRPRPRGKRSPPETPWRNEGPQRTRLPFLGDEWMRWKWGGGCRGTHKGW